MNEQKQKQVEKQAEETATKKDARPQTASAWKKFFGKKWAFPAAYMAAAAIILSIMWAYQSSEPNSMTENEFGLNLVENEELDVTAPGENEALPVTTPAELMQYPVTDMTIMEVATPFYDPAAQAEVKQSAMIQLDDTFMPSSGISLTSKDDTEFEVIAAMSGTVTRVDQVPYLGNLVEITHEDGVKSIYSSLANIMVERDQQVDQGTVLASAGRNELQKDLGVHLHFEILKDGQPVNPETYIASASQEESM
ncbi:peptidoglycan DD-metalloendopeptidase family protein [Marinicrinis sediminis]|uniref:Peptidoglycan DD-metalloendopeptidase family protein n=1 Tax=Marinicrinis sediminis TaxID=1652465 RepID=A0ABW5RB86_9BACL